MSNVIGTILLFTPSVEQEAHQRQLAAAEVRDEFGDLLPEGKMLSLETHLPEDADDAPDVPTDDDTPTQQRLLDWD